MKFCKMEPCEVCDKIERLSRAYGMLESCEQFSPPSVARQLSQCRTELSGVIADLGKLFDGEGAE